MDFSFLKLYDSINESLNDSEFKDAEVTYFLPIQLSPNETYLQITNYRGGLSFSGVYTAAVVDDCGNILKDITNNVFIEEFNDVNGIVQNKIEIVRIAQDFYGRAVFIRFFHSESGLSYYTRPIKITDKGIEKTFRFDYTNNLNLLGISYETAQCTQSIRLANKFTGYNNESEVGEYFQISTSNTISTRFLKKISNAYLIERIDTFTFERLQKVFEHDTIYIDFKRITTNPILEPSERIGQTNVFSSGFNAYLNKEDVYNFQYQIFTGIQVVEFIPYGVYTLDGLVANGRVVFNVNIQSLNNGTIKLYDSSNVLISTFDQTQMSITDNRIDIVGITADVVSNGMYYFTISSGLVTILGIDYEGVLDPTIWTFIVADEMFDSTEFDSTEFLTGTPNPLEVNLSLFYRFNETSGTTAVDSSANSNDGSITNVTIDQVGLIDKCYWFNNGTNDEFVDVPHSDSLSFGSGAFSIEVWLRPTADFGRILNKYNVTSGNREYRLFLQSGVLQFFIYTDASNNIGIADNVLMTTGSWQQVFITYDGSGNASGLKMKIDNTTASFAPSETGVFTGMPNTTEKLRLGQLSDNDNSTARYPGFMDILRIWKGYEVTDAEITALYNSGNGTETL